MEKAKRKFYVNDPIPELPADIKAALKDIEKVVVVMEQLADDTICMDL